MEAKTTPQPHTFKSKGSTPPPPPKKKPPRCWIGLTHFDNQGL